MTHGVPGGECLRSRAARGTLVNSAFLIATNALVVVQGVVVAALLEPATYGQWGLLLAAFVTLIMIGRVGVEDRYVQQDEPDQQRAFEIAFTLQALVGAVFLVVLAVGMPLLALVYGRPEIAGPGALLAIAMPALVLQVPLWTHYRRMDFFRQRALQAIDPVVTLVATVALVLAGLGLWALVLGALIGSWTAAAVIATTSPYALRLRWDAAAFREYRRFAAPLFVGGLSGAVLIQAPVIVASRFAGLEAIAAITLAATVAQFTTKVDSVVTQTLYPAICAVKDRRDLLFETFWKSNRLALLWAAPVGLAAPLFAGDFVDRVLGAEWRFAVPLIGIYGVNAVVEQIGFNWTAFLRAVGDTRPVGVAGVVGLVSTLAIPVPLLAISGLTAFGIGMAIVTVVALAVRVFYLRRLFAVPSLVRQAIAGIAPTLPAVGAVLVLRLLEPGGRSGLRVASEALMYAALTVLVTLVAHRRLLRESVGYLRARSIPAAAA